MTTIVIDASVAGKWVLPPAGELLVNTAVGLLDEYAAGRLEFIVPDLFWAELANLLWKAVRSRRCTREHAELALLQTQARQFLTVASVSLVEIAFGLASRLDRSVYDSIYIALALEKGATLVTADERLANATAAELPVKWLGAFSD